jgi:hypothetical protein
LRVAAVLSVAVAAGQTVETFRSTAATRAAAMAAAAPGFAASPDALPASASLSGGGSGLIPDLMGITSVTATSETPDGDNCAPTLALSAAEGAMIDLALFAPCDPGERIVVRHSGLSFTTQTGLDGRLALRLPGLDSKALVAVYFEGSAVALASVDLPGMAEVSRFVFQAAHPVEFELRAEEGGTFYSGGVGQPGSGRILTLGSASVAQPIIAQVYTSSGPDLTSAELSVEVRINARTCSRSFVAETQLSQGGSAVSANVPIAIPLCGTSGDILVLKNLVPDPTLALQK